MFFRLIDVKPGRGKYVKVAPAAGRSYLDRENLVVSILPSIVGALPGGAPAVALHGSSISTLPAQLTDWAHLQTMCAWSTAPLFCTLKSCTHDVDCCAIINTMVNAAAFPGSARPPCTKIAEDSPSARLLVDRGDICFEDGGFRLTARAMQAVIGALPLHSPRNIADPPAVRGLDALGDLTSWELLLHMRSLGWQWRKPNKKNLPLPYVAGAPKSYYSSGWSKRSLHKEYMLCLLRLPELTALNAEITSVPHCCVKDVYVRLLAGHPAPLQLSLADIEAEVPTVRSPNKQAAEKILRSLPLLSRSKDAKGRYKQCCKVFTSPLTKSFIEGNHQRRPSTMCFRSVLLLMATRNNLKHCL